MLFLFRGQNGSLIRAIGGVILIVIGIAIRGGALLAGIGAVLLLWGAIGALSSYRVHRRRQADDAGRAL